MTTPQDHAPIGMRLSLVQAMLVRVMLTRPIALGQQLCQCRCVDRQHIAEPSCQARERATHAQVHRWKAANQTGGWQPTLACDPLIGGEPHQGHTPIIQGQAHQVGQSTTGAATKHMDVSPLLRMPRRLGLVRIVHMEIKLPTSTPTDGIVSGVMAPNLELPRASDQSVQGGAPLLCPSQLTS